ncbi:MAG TPA: hypothetical protein VFU78_20735 [Thermomicrobiales bacterium]|nr:hypothetical protein [Thermomicrobiales bacterium]
MSGGASKTAEGQRLAASNAGTARWKRWGPYLAERAWGTVREDYSATGDAWDYFPHDHARSRAFRWSEDGLAGISDDRQRLCFALALWNGRDPILKERLFGLSGPEGNHGEDVKEEYFYLDCTPTHSYMRMLYKYPQAAFPYTDLVATNRQRGRGAPEYELLDTGVFAENRYFDVLVDYAKAAPNDILIRVSATNRGPDAAELHLLPTLWFRNTWSWGNAHVPHKRHPRPGLHADDASTAIVAEHAQLGRFVLVAADVSDAVPTLLFCENETNITRLYNAPNASPFVKDGINDAVVQGRAEAVNPAQTGTKGAFHYRLTLAAGATVTLRLRLCPVPDGAPADPFSDFDAVFQQRQAEADEFYAALQPPSLTDDERLVQRQALAGMLWSKQFYHFDVPIWLDGDPDQPPPPPQREDGRDSGWRHFNSADILSMPDVWEYPWFAAWDLAFHCLPLALVDPDFAKSQLILLGREWFQHPNGQLPAYEWAFDDVNPPVQAWAAWQVYQLDRGARGLSTDQPGDLAFLEATFHKLLLSFTWWVNRKDTEGNNIFQGGFLGLDNIGIFDRSQPLPTGGFLEQSDGTSWMGSFCLNMLGIAIELARHDPVYEDIATKFFEHFLAIANAMNNMGRDGISLWDEQDEFYYDVIHLGSGDHHTLGIRSCVGLIPLFAVTVLEPAVLDQLPGFRNRLEWYLAYRPQLAALVSRWREPGMEDRRLLAICRGHRMKCLLRRMLDEGEFLSPHGVRALSRYHADHPYALTVDGTTYTVDYEPAESTTGLFGGNSNWRGPVWFPLNYLLVESLRRYHGYYGDDFKVECPTGSGHYLTLNQIADELAGRLCTIFLRDGAGRRTVFGGQELRQNDEQWRDHLLFYEYFHGDNGAGLGASHQTGWTGLIAMLLQEIGDAREERREP